MLQMVRQIAVSVDADTDNDFDGINNGAGTDIDADEDAAEDDAEDADSGKMEEPAATGQPPPLPEADAGKILSNTHSQ